MNKLTLQLEQERQTMIKMKENNDSLLEKVVEKAKADLRKKDEEQQSIAKALNQKIQDLMSKPQKKQVRFMDAEEMD